MLIKNLKWNPIHTLATDGINDSDLTKMNPLTVKIFDHSLNKVTNNFLDVHNKKAIDNVITQN